MVYVRVVAPAPVPVPHIPETHTVLGLPRRSFVTDYATQPSPLLPSFLLNMTRRMTMMSQSHCLKRRIMLDLVLLNYRYTCRTGTKTPSLPLASEKLCFHLGSVARRVLARRAGSDMTPSKTHARSSSELIPGLMVMAVVWVCDQNRAKKDLSRRAVCGANRSCSTFSCGRPLG
jgi:hypothetical protein